MQAQRTCMIGLVVIGCALGLLPPPVIADERAAGTVARHDAFVGQRIAAVEVRGSRRIEPEAILAAARLEVGAVLTTELLARAARALWRTGLVADVRLGAERRKGGVGVIIEVVEQSLVERVLVAGNDAVALADIDAAIARHLRRGAILQPATVARARTAVEALYRERGHLLARVQAGLADRDGDVDVHFDITEGPRVEVRKVDFRGNRAVSDDELRAAIRTAPAGAMPLLGGPGVLDEGLLAGDALAITALYWDRGYLQVRVDEPRVRLSRDRRHAHVELRVHEGPRLRIGRVVVRGDELALGLVGIAAGDWFSRADLARAIEALRVAYLDRGHAFATVEPDLAVDQERETVDVAVVVVAGPPAHVERIEVSGNTRTTERVIRRELGIAEGDRYSRTALELSRARVRALGHFEAVEVTTRCGSAGDLAIVDVAVRERASTGSASAGAGFSSAERYMLQLTISEHNFLGRGVQLDLHGQLTAVRRMLLARYTEPRLLGSDWSMSAELYHLDRSLPGFTRNARGGALRLGRRLGEHLHVGLTYRLEDVAVLARSLDTVEDGPARARIDDTSVAELFRGGLSSSLRAQLVYDSRDDRLLPSRGWHLAGYAELAARFLGSETRLLRAGASARRWVPLGGGVVLSAGASADLVTSPDRRGVPISERFHMGGPDDLRGFDPLTVSPRISTSLLDPAEQLDELRIGGNLRLLAGAELEVPLLRHLGLSGVVFGEVGNAYNLEPRYHMGAADPVELHPRGTLDGLGGLRADVGAGLRWRSPIGLIRLELGVPLDRRDGERSPVLQVSFGRSF